MIAKKLLNHLDQGKVKYEIIEHRTIYTAYDAAATMHLPLKLIAKNLLVRADKNYVGAIVPADKNVDLAKLKRVINDWLERNAVDQRKNPERFKLTEKKYNKFNLIKKIKKVELPKETAMKKGFKVKPGGLHAFGSLYKIPTFIDKSLLAVTEIVLASGGFSESIKMKPKDFVSLEESIVGNFSRSKK